MVSEGKLSPEDAADLIDAFYASDRREDESEAAGTTPPPPPHAPGAPNPFKAFVENVEKLTKEGIDSVNWHEVANQARDNAKKGVDAILGGLEDISKGKVNIGWFTTQESKEVSLPLSVPTGKILRIENPCGEVKVVGGFDIGTATAHARFKAATIEEAREKAMGYTFIVEESDHMVLIRQPDVSGLVVDLEVQLAGNATVEVRSEAGNIQILDTKGGARINSRSGDIRLRGLVGPVEVSSDSGDVSIEDTGSPSVAIENKSGNVKLRRVRGNMNSRTASGNIDVDESSGKVLSLETVSGNISVDLDEPVTGSLNVRTVNGNSIVAVPDGSDCRVSLSTLRGNVGSGVVLVDESRADMRITGRLGDGSGTLDISAVNGNVALEMRQVKVTA